MRQVSVGINPAFLTNLPSGYLPLVFIGTGGEQIGRKRISRITRLRRKFSLGVLILMALAISGGAVVAGWYLVKTMHQETKLYELVDMDIFTGPEGETYVLPDSANIGDSLQCKWEVVLTPQGAAEGSVHAKIEEIHYGMNITGWLINEGAVTDAWKAYTIGTSFTVHANGTLIAMEGYFTSENLIEDKAGIDIELHRQT